MPFIEHKKTTYEELEAYVQAYKNGDRDAARNIIAAFNGFLHEYVNLLRDARFDMGDKKLREFIALFITKEKRGKLYQFRCNAHSRQEMWRVVATLQSIMSKFSYEDIYNELVLALLTLADRYNSNGNYFHTYVLKAFHFQFYRQLKVMVGQPIHDAFSNEALPYWDEACEGANINLDDILVEENPYLIAEPEDEINENWINGYTTTELFDPLTKTQRRILKMSYVDDLTDSEIAERLGVCRATVNRRRLAAKKYLEAELKARREVK